MTLSRRSLLRSAGITAVGVGMGHGFWDPAAAASVTEGPGPYGPLVGPDGNGLLLPAGFESRVLARSGEPVGGTGYVWHPDPDGGATFAMEDGGWVYVSNSEHEPGGVGALRFDADGEIVDGYSILDGTRRNCAGGPTPWGTWLSCEEVDDGQVWECAVDRPGQGVVRPALGSFTHEAAAVDPVRQQVYLTEDLPDGRLWRFTPTRYPDLDAGVLEVAVVLGGRVTWVRERAAGTPFDGGEGAWYDAGWLYFATKGDNRVWALDCGAQRIELLHDGGAPLGRADNLVVSRSGDLLAAEDDGNMEICLISPEGECAVFARIEGQPGSEVTGPAFSPDGSRLYFSSQRNPGTTYEVRGPFRSEAGLQRPVGQLAGAAPPRAREQAPRLLAVASWAAAIGGLVAVRRRRAGD